MKTAFQIPDDASVVVVFDARSAGAVGSLIKRAIRESQTGEQAANKLPSVALLQMADEALQNHSYVLDELSPWLTDAEQALAKGANEFENGE